MDEATADRYEARNDALRVARRSRYILFPTVPGIVV
jgi:hypothetical protein